MILNYVVSKISRLFATFFYIGYIPKMPGTAASFMTVLIMYFLPVLSTMQHVIILGVILVGGVIVSGKFAQVLGVKDPSIIVIDEVAGMSLALFFTPKTIAFYILSFGLFRFFDIYKPYPINIPDKLMTGGWGIMLDDILAGLATGIIMQFFAY